MIEEEDLKWLLHTPAGDVNFIHHLKKANLDTLRETLEKGVELSKTARKKIESQIRRKGC